MAEKIPKAYFSKRHSGFALIDPITQKYHRRTEPRGYFNKGLGRYIAISYVWGEWKDRPENQLPNWHAVRHRLLSVVESDAPEDLQAVTKKETSIWIDAKCIDQDSDADKAYWIPRMDSVYLEARCTILLLRGLDLTTIKRVCQSMHCSFGTKLFSASGIAIDEFLSPHNCLRSQCCTIISETVPQEDREICLAGLERLAASSWRKRAWILQEILLSRKYLLSWSASGWISLRDIALLAGALFREHPEHQWLEEFADWCRRLYYLRKYYSNEDAQQGAKRDLCDANVLQLSAGLEATVEADKFYALCGILRLKNIAYSASHTANEALQNVIAELVRNGRLSWLHAINPIPGASAIELRSDNLAPFILLAMGESLWGNKQKMEITETTILLTARKIGVIHSACPLTEYLQKVCDDLDQITTTSGNVKLWDHFSEDSELFWAAAAIRQLAADLISHLEYAMFEPICEALSISKELGSRDRRRAAMIISLYVLGRGNQPTKDDYISQVILSAALSIRSLVAQAAESFSIVKIFNRVREDDKDSIFEMTALGFSATLAGYSVYEVKGDDRLMFAMNGSNDSARSVFSGMLLDLDNGVVTAFPASLEIALKFWKKPKSEYLVFPYTVGA